LRLEGRCDFGVRYLSQKEIWRERDLGAICHFCSQACLGGQQMCLPEREPAQFGPRRRFVKLEQNLARFHKIAFAHEDVLNHATLEMLEKARMPMPTNVGRRVLRGTSAYHSRSF
jgi:hypothetical protein